MSINIHSIEGAVEALEQVAKFLADHGQMPTGIVAQELTTRVMESRATLGGYVEEYRDRSSCHGKSSCSMPGTDHGTAHWSVKA